MIAKLLIAGEFGAFARGSLAQLITQSGMPEPILVKKAFQLAIRARTYPSGVILMDLNLPDGMAAWRTIRANQIAVKLLVSSASKEPLSVMSVFRAGACGYLLESSLADELISAIHTVGENKVFISSALLHPNGFVTLETRHGIETLHRRLELERRWKPAPPAGDEMAPPHRDIPPATV